MDENFLQYVSYVIRDRAIPHLDDGLKPVRDRDAAGMVMTSKRIEFIGAAKPADWDDTLTGRRGRLRHFA